MSALLHDIVDKHTSGVSSLTRRSHACLLLCRSELAVMAALLHDVVDDTRAVASLSLVSSASSAVSPYVQVGAGCDGGAAA